MSKIKSLSGKCQNGCKEGFTIFKSADEMTKLVSRFPIFKKIGESIHVVGKSKRQYHVLTCDKLMADGSCDGHPENAPAWCKVRANA